MINVLLYLAALPTLILLSLWQGLRVDTSLGYLVSGVLIGWASVVFFLTWWEAR